MGPKLSHDRPTVQNCADVNIPPSLTFAVVMILVAAFFLLKCQAALRRLNFFSRTFLMRSGH